MIFKPLSKTKPLTTPFFAYSEVYWSYVINKYFDSRTPRYYLTFSNEIEKEQPKYYSKGVLVESLTPNGEKLINLYDYFLQNPDDKVDIKDYIKYCMKNYDYTQILLSDFIRNNKELGEELSYQILLSILRQDRNFHYENINLIIKDNGLIMAPPIDFEFSVPFLYPDKDKEYYDDRIQYINNLKIDMDHENKSVLYKLLTKEEKIKFSGVITRNICLIVRLYPNIILKFIKNLDTYIEDIIKINISDPDNYIDKLNSDYWKVGHAFYKDNDLEKYEELKNSIILENIDKIKIFERIKLDILEFCKLFSLTLKTYLLSYKNGIEDLELLTIKELLEKLGITQNNLEENIDKFILELKKRID